MTTAKKTRSKRRTVAPKGRQTIPPQIPLSQYGEKARPAYNAYVQRVGSINAITFEEWRSEWDEEQGLEPSVVPPKPSTFAVGESESIYTGMPFSELHIVDPLALHDALSEKEKEAGSQNTKRMRPQRSFGIFPSTDKALRQMAHQDRADASEHGACKNDWLEAAFLVMVDEAKKDPTVYEKWRHKARRLRSLSVNTQWRGE